MSTVQFSFPQISRLLNIEFDGIQFDAFCIHHFFEVYDRFSRGMRKDEKINLLLDHCRRVPEAHQKLVYLLGRPASQPARALAATSSTAPCAKEKIHFGFKKKKKLVTLLLACSAVSEQSRRQGIINELGLEIKNNVARNAVDRVEVMNLVTACLNYEDGLEELIEIVRFFEGDSIAMQKVDDFILKTQTRPATSSTASSPQQQRCTPEAAWPSFDSLLGEIISSRGGRKQLQLERLTRMTNQIHSRLNLPTDTLTMGKWYNELGVFSLNTGHALARTKLSRIVPLIYYEGAELTEKTTDELLLVIANQPVLNRLAILVLLGVDEVSSHAENLVNSRIRDVYAYDLVIMGRKKLRKLVSATEPLQALRKIILSEVHLTSISPFVVSGPTSDRMFFGREKELREITEHAATSSYILTGGRRVGKTSLLKRLERIRLPAAGFRTLYHDCSYTPSEDNLVKALRLERSWFPKRLANPPTSFFGLIQSLPDDKPLVILFDEADKLIKPDRAIGYPLFSTLRAQANAGRCHFVLSGGQSLHTEQTNPNSPLYNFANQMLIGRLDFASVKELVTQPMKQLEIELPDEREMVQRIWGLTAGHPNVVQRLCQRLIIRLNQRQNRSLSLKDVEAIIAEPDFLYKDFLKIYWEQATVLERLCSLVMAADSKVATLWAIHQALRSRGIEVRLNQVNDALKRLVDLRNILQRTFSGYEFAVTAFPEVVAQTARLDELIALNSETFQHDGDVVSY